MYLHILYIYLYVIQIFSRLQSRNMIIMQNLSLINIKLNILNIKYLHLQKIISLYI